jgi:hypothetical protein
MGTERGEGDGRSEGEEAGRGGEKKAEEKERRGGRKEEKLTSSSDPELTPLIDLRNGGARSVAMARAKSAATTR